MTDSVLVVCRLLAEHEGIEPLVVLLGDCNSRCRLYAACCITEMSSHGKHNTIIFLRDVKYMKYFWLGLEKHIPRVRSSLGQ